MSFEEACRELGITEAELESLVAAGEISSIKEGDTLYFKREVVKKFKKQRESEPTVLLTDEEINLLDGADEIDLLADDEGTPPARPAASKGAGKAEKAPAAAAKPELSLDDELPEIDLESDEGAVTPRKKGEEAAVKAGKVAEPEGDETLLNLDGLLEDDSEATTPVPGGTGSDDATMLDTDLLDLAGESDPFSADTAEETSGTDLTEAGTLLRSGGARVMQMKRKPGHPVLTAVLAVTCVLLILPLGVLTNLMFASSSESKTLVPPKNAYKWFLDYNILEGSVESLADFFK
ncbi:MAG: helix-turn-helix domain-containing protein [Planctomycetes bacterium]|nr:helix-turn-helix domain-containing protein [Planctomycetota bacterium]